MELTNEERATLDHRALDGYVIDLSPGYLDPTDSRLTQEGLIFYIGLSFVLFLAGLILSVVKVPFAEAITFAGPLLFIITLFRAVAQKDALTKHITLRYLASNPELIIGTDDPKQLPLVEQNLVARLSDLKAFLAQTGTLSRRRVIEI